MSCWAFVYLFFSNRGTGMKSALTASKCVRWCLARSELLLNTFVHPWYWHPYGLSPVCDRWCIFKFSSLENDLLHPLNCTRKTNNIWTKQTSKWGIFSITRRKKGLNTLPKRSKCRWNECRWKESNGRSNQNYFEFIGFSHGVSIQTRAHLPLLCRAAHSNCIVSSDCILYGMMIF